MVPLAKPELVLSSQNRLRRRSEFSDVVRRGRRASGTMLTVHVMLAPTAEAPRAGLIVSKAVGGSVVRSRVARRLRHELRPMMSGLPAGSRLVVRAAPRVATADSSAIRADLGALVHRLLR
ncbi:MAG: ribonuclease P protein component [Mycobacteriales bacterium]